MNEAIGMLVILLGQGVALFMRLYPNSRLNAAIPKVVWLANFLGIIVGFIDKFLGAIGPVASIHPSGPLMAIAWGSVLGLVKVLGSVWLGGGLGAVQGWIWDQWGHKVIPQGALDAGKKV